MSSVSAARPGSSPGARNTDTDSSGWPPRKATDRSTKRNTGTSASPQQMHASDQAGQFSWCPSISGSTTRHTAGTTTASPGRSRRRVRAGASAGITRGSTRSTASPIGTLTRKTGRQDAPNRSAVTSTPPITCPATNPEDSTAV
jgi:hypothetical protein